MINFEAKFQKFTETWQPKILGKFDDYYLKASKMKGEFVWHKHDDVDELFIVTAGSLKILNLEMVKLFLKQERVLLCQRGLNINQSLKRRFMFF